MILLGTQLEGVRVVEPEPIEDERGLFARTWDADDFANQGLSNRVAQCSLSFNRTLGTLRGLHYQVAPHEEAKLVRCTAGSVYDVAVDLRSTSPTFCDWFGIELSHANRRALYIPEGCAHGFLTLTDGAEVAYQISARYSPEAGRGARWDDPAFGIEWPGDVVVINERDRSYPDFAASSGQP